MSLAGSAGARLRRSSVRRILTARRACGCMLTVVDRLGNDWRHTLRVAKRSGSSAWVSARNSGLVLGLDQSYSGFGLCVMDAAGKGTAAHKGFPPDKSSGVDRLIDIECWLAGVLAVYGDHLKHVCMEGYAPGAKQGREIAGELGSVVKLVLRRLGVPVGYPTIVAPLQLKKYATGRTSNVEKSDIKLAVYKKWGEEFRNDNEADAYVLAKIAHRLHYGGPQLAYERDVTDKLRRHTEWVRQS